MVHSGCTKRPQKLEDLMIESFFVGFCVIFQFFPSVSDAAW